MDVTEINKKKAVSKLEGTFGIGKTSDELIRTVRDGKNTGCIIMDESDITQITADQEDDRLMSRIQDSYQQEIEKYHAIKERLDKRDKKKELTGAFKELGKVRGRKLSERNKKFNDMSDYA